MPHELHLPDCFTKDCKFCQNEGILEFKHDGKSYPNAPCPVCRWYDLRVWLKRWCLNPNIAVWLWQHYSPRMTKAQRVKKRHDWRGFRRYNKRHEDLPNKFLKLTNTNEFNNNEKETPSPDRM